MNKPKKVTQKGKPSNQISQRIDRSITLDKNDSGRKSRIEQRRLAPIFQHKHINDVISETWREEYYTCSLCPNSEFTFRCIRKYALSKRHRENAKDDSDFLDFRKKCERIPNDDDEEERIENLDDYSSDIDNIKESQEDELPSQQKNRERSNLDNLSQELKETKKRQRGFPFFHPNLLCLRSFNPSNFPLIKRT